MSKANNVRNIAELRDAFRTEMQLKRQAGDTWIDHAGNICQLREDGTISCQTINDEPSLTIQSEKDSCDFNLIYQKYVRTGLMSNIRTTPPRYGDFTDASDYHTSVLRAQQAHDEFMLLPASIRARFSNDPGELIGFLADENNRAEAIQLGLIDAPQDSKIPQGDIKAGSSEPAKSDGKSE